MSWPLFSLIFPTSSIFGLLKPFESITLNCVFFVGLYVIANVPVRASFFKSTDDNNALTL